MQNGFLPFSQPIRSFAKFFSLFSLCFLLVVGCNSNQSATNVDSETASSSDRVTVGMTIRPRTLDPADSYEIAGLNAIYNLGDTLYTYEPGTTELMPLLATEMPTVSEDGLTYTIPLREGVVFHDGTDFNAEAMAFSLQRFMENGGKPSFLLSDVVDNVEATGDDELTIQLKQPFAAFPSLLAFTGTAAVSPEAYTIGAGEFSPNIFVGTGPYKLAEFSSDSLQFEPFEDYWGEEPRNSGVDMQIYGDNSANLFNAFRTGAVDIAYQSLDPDQMKTLLEGTENEEWQAIEAPGTAVNFLVLNRQQPPLDQLEVRQAIASIMNRALLRDRVFQGQADPLYSLIPTAFEVSEPTFEAAYGDANPEKAEELLTEAGFSADNPVMVEIWYPSSSTPRSLTASTLKAYAEQELGGIIQFEPKAVEGATFFKNIADGIYPAALSNWYPDYLDADNFIQPLLSCTEGSTAGGCIEGSAQNQGSFYYSDRMNELISAQRQESDPAAREAIFTEIQGLLAEDVPYVPLWQNKEYVFVQNNLEGVMLNPAQSIPFWRIEKS